MALRNRSDDKKRISEDYLSPTISSSTLEIVLDEQTSSNSGDDDSIDQARQSEAGTTTNESSKYRKKKQQMPLRDPKSHRLIEKRRRDRMNTYLSELLLLTPHENNQHQRRIEKTEIIEMAIKHIRYLISTLEKKSENIESTIDAYRTGYRNALSDVYEFLDDYSNSDQLLADVVQYFKEKEIDLKALTDIPDKKRPKYVTLPDRRTKLTSPSSSSKEQFRKSTLSDKDDDKLCVISEVLEYKHNEVQSSNDERQNSSQQSDSNVKVPIFVLHPSGTHYIPMCIDASVVSEAFKKNTNLSHTLSTTDQVQCHPVSIPVNFNSTTTTTTLCDSYELDIQNINVIGTRHQTSVRPN
ncbi:unnamed protein product [Adineta steineri]|uniref:BHLH domain-containing protein n=1 Tax=Adineta steineri TaxID=433720 RepID=A0A818NLY0_9BILA|nr:unnamed protein product [Adineta steineri]CAF3607261.1 unnamed protein product [Adineta steineri]